MITTTMTTTAKQKNRRKKRNIHITVWLFNLPGERRLPTGGYHKNWSFHYLKSTAPQQAHIVRKYLISNFVHLDYVDQVIFLIFEITSQLGAIRLYGVRCEMCVCVRVYLFASICEIRPKRQWPGSQQETSKHARHNIEHSHSILEIIDCDSPLIGNLLIRNSSSNGRKM